MLYTFRVEFLFVQLMSDVAVGERDHQTFKWFAFIKIKGVWPLSLSLMGSGIRCCSWSKTDQVFAFQGPRDSTLAVVPPLF
jgi:hypothetical protein